jgi:hypothetical protein
MLHLVLLLLRLLQVLSQAESESKKEDSARLFIRFQQQRLDMGPQPWKLSKIPDVPEVSGLCEVWFFGEI